ncbi:LRR receptor-like serine/threonine-protein kinase GSO2, partial [Durio zibethinus]|uniref:LRR receptor-like serine/threonine-protein kinase GSO2 n=1 Tax=Durio zibethinus TaxID=66656 RepID=A0A6P5ZGD3_DURZI
VETQSSNCCEWDRVECNTSTGRVMRLFLNHTFTKEAWDDLSYVYYDDTWSDDWYLNASLFLPFEELNSLYLRGNSIAGCVYNEELNALSNLEELYMGDNEVNDFITSKDNETELRLINLEVLDLSGNLFNNSILSSLGRLSNLKSLLLEDNNLEGSIDLTVLNALSNLKELSINCRSTEGLRNTACSLSPKSPGVFLPSLKTLILAGFSFNGTMTTQKLHNFRNLEELILGDSFLQTNFLRNFGELTSLKLLQLYGCEINNIGSLTPPQGFCEMTNLQELDINDNNLKDYLPECFSNLTSLERLDLRSNQFFGNISVLKSLTTLKSLDLSSNQFSGSISALDSLTSLQVLSVSNNYFQIPSSLGPFFNLSKLKYLYADNNTIYAETEMHSLAPTFQLKEITMACCGNGGSFPQFLYHQKDLQTVDLSNIYFKGDQFPNWLLKNNTKLARLFLANSSLSGPIQLPLPSHLGLSSLDISNNFFNGSIPIEIGAQLPSLNFLNMSKNHFNGSIPSSFGDMSSLCSLDLSNNLLSGGIPQHMAMGCSSLAYLALSNNTLQGKLFSVNFSLTNLMELQLDGNNFSGRIPDFLSNKTYLNTLDVSNNQLSGRIPRWMGNMSSLETIIMSNNHLEGTIPMEFCQLDLILLDLSVNNISGSLPSCFSPSQIRQVHLSKNRLRGSLPDSLGNCSTLVTLDVSDNFLTGNIPSWVGRLSNLSYLLLNNNKFEGRIPIELCNLSHLSLINLSHNNLSGRIPPCIKITTLEDVPEDYGKILPYMSGIDLSFNNLVGEIPDEIGNFRNILVLSLSHNSLTGPIPPTFANLMRIESLDLSYNN